MGRRCWRILPLPIRLPLGLHARSAEASSGSPSRTLGFPSVFSEPALSDALMVGAIILLPLAGLAPVTRGLALYLLLLTVIVAGGLVATTQAGVLNVPASHVGITLYLALSSVVMAAFFSGLSLIHI